jgi:hypothetical protein
MGEPQAPFLELQFYWNLPEQVAFRQLIMVLLDLGARFSGRAYVHIGNNFRDRSFAGIADEPRYEVDVHDLQELERYLLDPSVRVIEVPMNRATGAAPDEVAETVTYVSISSTASTRDYHPLAIYTDGEMFSGPPGYRDTELADVVGHQIYLRFKTLIESLEPIYAAITSEESLPPPSDLATSSYNVFRDFYISERHFGQDLVAEIKALYADAYIEPIGDGVYISTSDEPNPSRVSLEIFDALERGDLVAKMLAS